MTRALHRWTEPQRPSPELSIRTCIKCGLISHSRHEVFTLPPGISHWKEYYSIDAPDVRLTVMPECVREKVGTE